MIKSSMTADEIFEVARTLLSEGQNQSFKFNYLRELRDKKGLKE
jgi:hypothetical protein